jgi:hypothetical protein
MQSVTINFQNNQIFEKVFWLLEHFKKDGVEVIKHEDIEDLKILAKTRNEESISFIEYMKNEH